jgi:hypothetical protein
MLLASIANVIWQESLEFPQAYCGESSTILIIRLSNDGIKSVVWPSTYNYGTLGFMIDRIDDELTRNGTLTSQISQTIYDAIAIYQRERFRFNETFVTQFTTVVGQQNYNMFTDASFPNVSGPQQIYHIDWMTITLPPAVFDVPRIQPEELLILTQTGTQMGQPYAYAFSNETIMLYPIPSLPSSSQGGCCTTGYIMSIGAHITYQQPESLSDNTNRWMIDGEKLIRSRAKYELAINYLKDLDMAALMSPFPPEMNKGIVGATWDAYTMLNAEMNRLMPRGLIRPMHF